MSGIIPDKRKYQVIDVDAEENDATTKPSSLAVRLPVELYNSNKPYNSNIRHDKHATSGLTGPDNTSPDPKDLDVVYNIITKELNKRIDDQINVPLEMNHVISDTFTKLNNNQRKEDIQNKSDIKMNVNEKILNSNSNKLQRKPSFINDAKIFIKHNLPLSEPPKREKYKIFGNNASEPNNMGNINVRYYSSSTSVSNGTQTDQKEVTSETQKNLVNLIDNTISKQKIDSLLKFPVCKDAATNTDLGMNEINTDKNMNDTVQERIHNIQMLEACSLYNKEQIALLNKKSVNDSFPNLLDFNIAKINLEYLKDALQKIFGPLFKELLDSVGDKHQFNAITPENLPKKTATRKRRISVPAVPHQHNNVNNEDPSTIVHQAQMAHNYPVPRSNIAPQLNYVAVPQLQEYMSDMAHAESSNYGNRNIPDPRSIVMNQSYPSARPQMPQRNLAAENAAPFYNTGPRMMQSYAVPYTRDHQEYYNVGNGVWEYHQHFRQDSTQNMRTSYMNGEAMSARVMAVQEQRHYQLNQVQRNSVHNIPNYHGGDWNMNIRPNGPM